MGRPILPTAKRAKIELRVNDEQKKILKAAAANEGMPTATWVLACALQKAKRSGYS